MNFSKSFDIIRKRSGAVAGPSVGVGSGLGKSPGLRTYWEIKDLEYLVEDFPQQTREIVIEMERKTDSRDEEKEARFSLSCKLTIWTIRLEFWVL